VVDSEAIMERDGDSEGIETDGEGVSEREGVKDTDTDSERLGEGDIDSILERLGGGEDDAESEPE